MTETKKDLVSEIEYIKEMAQGGDKKPVPFAKIIFWAGIVWLFYYIFLDIVFFKFNLFIHTLKDVPGFEKLYIPYIAALENNLSLIFFFLFLFIIIFLENIFSALDKNLLQTEQF